jgi:hypothetical protein
MCYNLWMTVRAQPAKASSRLSPLNEEGDSHGNS